MAPAREEAEMQDKRRLYRSADEKMVAGVCGGLAEYFDVDPTIVRVAYVLLTLVSGLFPGVILYAVLAIVMPMTPQGLPPITRP